MRQKLGCIYKLTNKISNKIYIGQTTQHTTRIIAHFNDLKRNKHSNSNMQKDYNSFGKESFKFEILLYCEPFELTRYEQFFVDTLNPEYNICKKCVSSRFGVLASEDTRKKMRGRKQTDDHRKNNSLGHMGIRHTEATKEKISKTTKGRKGKPLSDEAKEKLRKSNSGRKHTDETKKKLSALSKGHIMPEHVRLKLLESKLGKHHSPETIEKLQKAQQARQEIKRKNGQILEFIFLGLVYSIIKDQLHLFI